MVFVRENLPGKFLQAHIKNIFRPITAHAALKVAVSLLLAAGPFFLGASNVSFGQEAGAASTLANAAAGQDAKADAEFEAKKAEIFKKYNVQESKPGEYPITILPSDRVLSVMHGVTDVGDIAWLDNDTIIYVPQTGLTFEEVLNNPGSLWLNTLNLKTLEAKRIAKASADHFCYDYETHNIRFVGVTGDGTDAQKAIVYGKLGSHLDTFVPPPRIKGRAAHNAHQTSSFTNHLDCTFYPQLTAPGTLGRTAIRTADGNLTMQQDANGQNIPGAYVVVKPDGMTKKFKLGNSNLSWFQYDNFSKQYWHYDDTHWQKGQPDGFKVWRLNKNLDVVSEEFYRHGPWAYGYPLTTSVRLGFVLSAAMYGGELTSKTKIHDLTYLITKSGTFTEIAEDELGATFAVSPDGCKAAATKYAVADHGNPKPTGEIAIINFCKKQ